MRRYPATWQGIGAARRHEQQRAATRAVAALPRLPVLSAVPVAEAGLADLADAALDALFHLGGGPARHLELVAAQLEASSLFEYRFTRALEDVGHIEVLHGRRLRPEAWQATPPMLVELPNGRGYLLVGAIGRHGLADINQAVTVSGGSLRFDVDALGLPRRVATGLSSNDADSICRTVRIGSKSLRLSLATSERLTSLLPPISEVVAGLSTQRLPPHRKVERFDPATASWRMVDDVNEAGGYRLEGFGNAYVLKLAGDPDGSARPADARLVRYGAAVAVGEGLVAYDPGHEILEVPLGAALPGLYARAAVLASGWLPARSEDGWSLLYRDVPPAIANMLIDKLAS